MGRKIGSATTRKTRNYQRENEKKAKEIYSLEGGVVVVVVVGARGKGERGEIRVFSEVKEEREKEKRKRRVRPVVSCRHSFRTQGKGGAVIRQTQVQLLPSSLLRGERESAASKPRVSTWIADDADADFATTKAPDASQTTQVKSPKFDLSTKQPSKLAFKALSFGGFHPRGRVSFTDIASFSLRFHLLQFLSMLCVDSTRKSGFGRLLRNTKSFLALHTNHKKPATTSKQAKKRSDLQIWAQSKRAQAHLVSPTVSSTWIFQISTKRLITSKTIEEE
ncbi:uncharacterized protein LOC104414503 [Eucalyptus grandis]|uniref:uncharacterized protein LOC104414503 n=1 Tax=Eucalyptus grandis TaxID=71139 RepID=UPI00192E94B2|nr:uncharacterized protein LOC104414503 [Eucalyptus grandis]